MLLDHPRVARGRVTVDLQDPGKDLEAADPRLLGCLAERGGGQRRVGRLAMPARLQPASHLRMKNEEDAPGPLIDHRGAGGDVCRSAAARQSIGPASKVV
jgi:hypothetical protein